MKILTIHADFLEFEAKKKALKQAEENIKEGRQRVEECLVIFTAVEKRDEINPGSAVDRYVREIKNIAQQVNAHNIVLYPYAHLSSELGSPKVAEKVMKDAEKILQEKYKVTRAPFGWYKAFNIACKGHPLSELSREFGPEGTEKENEGVGEAGERRGKEEKADKKVEENEKKSDLTALKREYKDEPFVFSEKELSKEEKINLSAAFIAGKAVKSLFPEARLGSLGLHQDTAYIDLSHATLRNEDFPRLEKQMQKIVQADLPIEAGTKEDIEDNWQRQILQDIGQDKKVYQLENVSLVPLYQQPFVNSTKEVAAFKLLSLGSAYWKGNEKNEQLQRLYCAGFPSGKKREEYLQKQEDAEARSHLKLGRELGLFLVSDLVGAGLPLLAPKGTIIKNEIIRFLWELHKDKGYQQVTIPHIAKEALYRKSGHLDKFGEALFHVKGRDENYILKPMNCPHHIQIFSHFSYSYRDLPVRFFEPTMVYRDEKSGQLAGLSRVRSITQDDGHIFCRLSQVKQEVKTMVGIILDFYKTMRMDKDYWVSLSASGEDKSKYLGEKKAWDEAEKALEEVAKEEKLPFRIIKGEAAFYGPKLDFMFKDALGREQQLATIQLDFNLPERFELSFMNEESRKERPVMIHRAISGSLERFMSILIEHFAGKFPLWLSPVQVKVLTITDRNKEFAEKVVRKLKEKDFRVELDDRTETMGKKVLEAVKEKVNYIVTVGDKEVEKGVLAIRDRKGGQRFGVEVDDFISEAAEERDGRMVR